MGNCFLYKRGMGSAGASEVVYTAMGKLLTFKATDKPLKGLRIFGKTTQNGIPTPDAPLELVSAGASGAINTTVAGKNLFALIDNDTTTENGITVAKDKASGKATLNGTATARRTARLGNITADANMEIIFSGSSSVCELWLTNSAGSNIVAISTGGNSTKYKMTKGESYRVYACVYSGTVCNNVVVSPMIRLASIADATFEPYKPAQTLTLSTPNGLPGIPVSSGGNYTDENGQQWVCDEVDFEKGVYVQRVGAATFNGTEGWRKTSNNENTFHIAMSDMVRFSVAPAYCTHFVYNTISGVEGTFRMSDVLYFYGTSSATLDEWKAWLAENPISLRYVLTEPIETPLPPEELAQYAALHTNYPNTTIYNDAGANMEVKYL